MIGEQHLWDWLRPKLMDLFREPWGERREEMSARQLAATPFAVRAWRRLFAVDTLFKSGFYLESHALIRNAYEDWIQLAYLLREPGDDRCAEYAESGHKHDAKVHDALKVLCGPEATDQLLVEPIPPEVAKYSRPHSSKASPRTFAHLADDVGLRQVHDFAYTYLSGRSHPNARTVELFDEARPVAKARIPAQEPSEEALLALWLSWFTARIVVLGAREFGIDREPFCDDRLIPFAHCAGVNLETCVFVKEYAG